ncbi:hypothetical protein ACF3NT_08680 [Naumannella halotolerans]|uniref:Uncharacterized protein n=1 Tax=Naumannella halotolerans TaxID=993414 RepID=A0A4R7J9B9_9ACTN|nr:hypothetical protein [Naumannella halotolerans]TDT34110.1 hypothetical protein CLV29_1763 [Naumannella halotolerans]
MGEHRSRPRPAWPTVALAAVVVVIAIAVVVAAIRPSSLLGRRPVGEILAEIPDTTPMGHWVTWAGIYRDDFSRLDADLGLEPIDWSARDPADGFVWVWQYDACTTELLGFELVGDRVTARTRDLNRECYRSQVSVRVVWLDWETLPDPVVVGTEVVHR